MKYIVLICSAISFFSCESEQTETVVTTHYFEFHNNYWINLHHFLYQNAQGSQLQKLEEDGFTFPSIGEIEALEKLSDRERKILKQAILYYKENLIDKELRRDLGEIRIWLQQQDQNENIKDTTHSRNLTNVLNEVSEVYRQNLWKVHQDFNEGILNKHLESIKSLELSIIPTMESLSQNKWLDSIKVRVDLTVYANWAGAYTSTRPEMNIVISSIDPLNNTTSFVETIFHEGTYLLYRFGESPVRDEIFNKSKELGMEFPANLWHASLFYLCGRATQDELKKVDIEHVLTMDVRSIFKNYNTPTFRRVLEDYYQKKSDLDVTVHQLLYDIKQAQN